MTDNRKKLNAKLRRKYGYSTAPTVCGNGTYLFRGDYDPITKENDNYIRMELGWHKQNKVHILTGGNTADRLSGRGSAVLSFDEIEILYNIVQELKKEWDEN